MVKRPHNLGKKPPGWAKAASRDKPVRGRKHSGPAKIAGRGKPADRPARQEARQDIRQETRHEIRQENPQDTSQLNRQDNRRIGAQDRKTPQAKSERRTNPRSEKRAGSSVNLLWGFHPVREALRAPRRKINQLYASAAAAARLQEEIAASRLQLVVMDPGELDAMLPSGAVHQGLAARVEPLPPLDLSDLPADGLVLVLDQITDPHNLGAIIRTAAAFAVSAIVMTERNAPPLSGIVGKSASGGLEHVPVIQVVNLARAMEELGGLGYWRIGLDSDGEAAMDQTRLERPLALVLGAEGKGLRRLTRENCDAVARLEMPGAIKSLNVSNACAVALTIVSASATTKS